MNKDTSTDSTQSLRLQLAIDNAQENILFLAGLPDKELSKRLDVVHIQSDLAIQNKNLDSLELLKVWRSQLIEARIYKAENNIADAPNEIELAIANIETIVVKAEERKDVLENEPLYQKIHKPKIKEDNSDQMSLF